MSTLIQDSQAEIERVIQARVQARWIQDEGGLLTPIQFPAVNGLLDVDGTMRAEPPTDYWWLKLDVLYGDSFIASVAGGECGLNRNTGVIQLSVYGPRLIGTRELLERAGKARKIFSRYVGEGLRCLASSAATLRTEAGWLVGIIRTPMEFYESES